MWGALARDEKRAGIANLERLFDEDRKS